MNPFCRVESAFRTHASFLGTYGGSQAFMCASPERLEGPGPQILANVVYPNAQVRRPWPPVVRRAANVTVNVVDPGTLDGEALNELDLRSSNCFGSGTTRRRRATSTW